MTLFNLVAFEDRKYEFIFVPIPGEVNRFLRTDKSVSLAGCPTCRSMIGYPCKGLSGRWIGSTCHARRTLAKGMKGGDDVLPLPPLFPSENPQ